MSEKRFVTFFIAAVFILLVVCIFVFNGTVDSGDSVMHYFYARFAINHPLSFLDNWAKPLYVALATPFAQLGFKGIKLFNSINTIVSMTAAYLIARRFNIKYSWLVPIFLLLSPLNFALSFSGLTEPLFASVLTVGLCLLFYDKVRAGLVVLSFLPFARSEGMFLLMPVIAFLLMQRNFKSLPWLVTGNVVYALIGWFHFKDLLWFYHSNPYSMFSSYGNGEWDSYFNDMPLIAGQATSILAIIGSLVIPFTILKKQKSPETWQLILVWVITLMYFFFHVFSWTFGMFGSFGMARIIIGICPLIVIIAVYGFSSIMALLTPNIIGHIKANYNPINPKWVAYSVLALFGGLFAIMAVANHYFFRSTAFDFGPYNYAFWDYAHFHLTFCPVYDVFNTTRINFLQDHFSLLLMVLVPFYWLMNWLTGTYTLLTLQTLFIVWGAWAIYKLVELKTTDKWLAVGAVVYYFLLQGRYSAFDEDCNIIIMASCFVPMFLWYFESKRYMAAFIVFVIAVFSREDMSLWFAFVALVVIIWHRREKKLVLASVGYIVASILVFVLTIKVFIPLVQSPDRKYNLFTYSALGSGPFHALQFIYYHPLDSFTLLFKNQLGNPEYDGVKMEFYMVYLISGGFMLFYRPQYFIWFIPLIAQKMFNDQPMRWSIESYYSIQIATLLPIPVFIILASEQKKIWRYGLAVMICTLALTVTLYESNYHNHKLAYHESVKANVFNSRFFMPDYNTIAMHKDLAVIPADAHVSASASVLPQLSQRKIIYEFPDEESDIQYVAAFTKPDYFGMPDDVYLQRLFNEYVFNAGWQILSYHSPLIVLKKGNAINSEVKYDSVYCNAEGVAPDGKHLVATNGLQLDNDSALRSTEHVHHGKHSVRLTKEKQYGMTMHLADVNEGDFLLVSVWRYSTIKDNGSLVVSAGSSLYIPNSVAVTKDSAGWEKIVTFCTVPANHNDMGVYIWNNTDSPVWFDDMTVKRLAVHK